jgi:formamidopyrimidine-DNA glycosylase
MPELPEVESLRCLLERRIVGAQLQGSCFVNSVILRSHSPAEFSDLVHRRTIIGVGRRGKYLLLHLSASVGNAPSDVRILIVHLRMRGSLQVEPAGVKPAAYHCATLELDGDRELRFYDMWRWGEWWLLEANEQPNRLPQIGQLGPEPFDPGFTREVLYRQLSQRRGALKPLLLSQRVVAGLGNIYCDESLHRARLHPARIALSVTVAEAEHLHNAIQAVLGQAVAQGGAYAALMAAQSRNLDSFAAIYTPRIYDRPGRSCPTCGQSLHKMSLHGRGTTYCPVCQPAAVAD